MWAIKLASTSSLGVCNSYISAHLSVSGGRSDPKKTKAKAPPLFIEKVKKISAPFNVTTDNGPTERISSVNEAN